jgi:hypothetical protein
MVDIAALVVSVVTLVLDRLDNRQEKLADSPDLREALLGLYTLVRDWTIAMARTNDALEDWIDRGKPSDRHEIKRLDTFARGQYVSGRRTLFRWDPSIENSAARNRATTTSMADVLSIYAPELKEDLEIVFDTRSKQLDRLYAELKSYKADRSAVARVLQTVGIGDSDFNVERLTAKDIEAFRQAKANMFQASGRLASFIASRFPLGSNELED